MIARLKNRLTYANVVASIALFLALGGTSYAAIVLPRDSVSGVQLRARAVTSDEVKDRSLHLRDLSMRARRSLSRAPTSQVTGTPVVAGTVAAVATTYKTAAGTVPIAPVDDTSTASATVTCDGAQRVAGGGVKVANSDEMYVADSYPDAGGKAWTAHVTNEDEASALGFTVYAICVP